jgi:hypothetical protein
VWQWVTNPFWFEDPEFPSNLSVSHGTFLSIVEIVKHRARDSVNPLTGAVREKAEFKVAVGLYHLGHCCTWRTTSNACCIGLTTAEVYVWQFASAIILHGKPDILRLFQRVQ